MRKFEELKSISKVAYEFLNSFCPEDYEDGRYEIGGGCYVNVESYTTQYRTDRKYEAHRKYIDVQYMISGREIITKWQECELKCVEEYREDKDIIFYENCLKGVDMLLDEKEYLIFRPGEAHMPCICINQKETVRKAVVKIPVVNI